MREYSVRERIACGILALVFLTAAATLTALLAARAEMRTVGTWASALGSWGGAVLFLKILLTGTSWAFFELDIDVFGSKDSLGDRNPKE